MTLPPPDLTAISARTREHYENNAENFKIGTQDHDVSQNINALLNQIHVTAPYTILDFGCGPGRDLASFKQLGHYAIGLDGTAKFVEMARAATGCEVWHQDFLQLDLPGNYFDGIFANASLFHIPSQELPRILRQLNACLKPGGVLFSSNPRGTGQEGWSGDRYGAYHSLETWRSYLTDAGFTERAHYYRPEGLPRDQQPWLATVFVK
ncbi:class I SAM-dependent methyltransferase [Solimicrobium silvestre]|uniref:Methyltransferase domain n=1 Tax=Solimicrobium silvestre TaxID=2099400 RepID=A0A2S9GU31_9BURK|nr:class I SAM-dependent methyltransferase [Solimicrobium silvestre]PRC91245.1 Methyltransferase domain [Solimicrobium silvestre]